MFGLCAAPWYVPYRALLRAAPAGGASLTVTLASESEPSVTACTS